MPTDLVNPNRARRAIGAMFFIAFGGAWLEYYAFQVIGKQPIVLAAIALVTVVLVVFAYHCYKQNQPALMKEAPSPERRRSNRIFNIVNAGQWVGIFVAGNVLVNLGLSNWVIPCIIFIVGLHLLPLAHVFANPPHYITGAALIILAVSYPWLAPSGPASSVGCLGAGLILWASALWALMANNSSKRTRHPRAA